jgi:hypothetical protein
MLSTQQLYVGLSARSFIQKFQQRSLVLFKLLLLEKRVLFFRSPVKDLCGTLLTLLSLHPGMLERGLVRIYFLKEYPTFLKAVEQI